MTNDLVDGESACQVDVVLHSTPQAEDVNDEGAAAEAFTTWRRGDLMTFQ